MDADGLISILQAINVLFGAIIAGIAFSLCVGYTRMWIMMERPKDRLLPIHVSCISLSYTILAIAGSYEVASNITRDALWLILLYELSWLLGAVAFWSIYKHLRTRPTKIEMMHDERMEAEESPEYGRRWRDTISRRK